VNQSSKTASASQLCLYHGTSSIFLDEIMAHGLGGKDPIREGRVLEFARTIEPLVTKQFGTNRAWMQKVCAFQLMCKQSNSGLNYQHGDTYLTPSRAQAIGYTISKRWGSELLSCTLDFLDELVRLQVPGVCDVLFQKYRHIFRMLSRNAAPILIEIPDLSEADLVLERGEEVGEYLTKLKAFVEARDQRPFNIPGSCFRLRRVIPKERMKIWLVNVIDAEQFDPKYSLYEIPIQKAERFRGLDGDREEAPCD
jgi:hypothetical protein